MRYAITIRSLASRDELEVRLSRLVMGGAFHVRDLVHLSAGTWSFTIQPIRPELAVGFGKVAELLVLLARECDVHALERLAVGTLAAAS